MNKKILKKVSIFLITIFSFNVSTPVFAATITLPAGTPVSIRIAETLSSEKVMTGYPVRLEVASDVKRDGKTVIKSGAIATGSVTNSVKSGIIGKPGEIAIQINSVTAIDGNTIPVTAYHVNRGEDKSTMSLVVGLFLCIFVLFQKGGEGNLQAGNIIQASTTSEAYIEVN